MYIGPLYWYAHWNSLLAIAFIVQLPGFSRIKTAANWNKNAALQCCMTWMLNFAPVSISFVQNVFYANIIEQSDQTSFAQTIVIMRSQLCQFSRIIFKQFAFKLTELNQMKQFYRINPDWVGFTTNVIWCSNHSADCFESEPHW